jgi:hypothetical protein
MSEILRQFFAWLKRLSGLRGAVVATKRAWVRGASHYRNKLIYVNLLPGSGGYCSRYWGELPIAFRFDFLLSV